MSLLDSLCLLVNVTLTLVGYLVFQVNTMFESLILFSRTRRSVALCSACELHMNMFWHDAVAHW
jgi:hypothetical protein